MKKFIILMAVVTLCGCAKGTKEISSTYTSPLEYSHLSCDQIRREIAVVSRKTSELGAQVDKTASDDSSQMGVGLVLFWPALFFLDGDTPQAAEYARLKGQFDALESVAIEKNCGVTKEIERARRAEEIRREKLEQKNNNTKNSQANQ